MIFGNCADFDKTPKPEPPECLSSLSGLEYNGSQYIAASGKHCVPWIDNRIPDPYDSVSYSCRIPLKKYLVFFEGIVGKSVILFQNQYFEESGGRLNSVNYCRNLDLDPSGAFCFVQRSLNDPIVEKELCSIRPCLMGGK